MSHALTMLEVDNLKDKNETSLDFRPLSRQECRNLIRTIESQQQEIEQLKYGPSVVTPYLLLQQENSSLIKQLTSQQQTIEQLQNDNINSEMNLSRMTDLYERQRKALEQAKQTMTTLNNLCGLGYDKHRWLAEALKQIAEVEG